MNLKTHLCQGVDAKGKRHVLYVGADGGAARAAYEEALSGEHSGVIHAQLYIGIQPDRRRDVPPDAKAAAAAVKAARIENAENDKQASAKLKAQAHADGKAAKPPKAAKA